MAGKYTNAGASGVTEENVVVESGRDSLPPAGGKKGGHGQSKSRDRIASLDGRTCVLEETMGDVKDRLGFVEQNLKTLEDHVLEELESLKKAMMGQDELRTQFMEFCSRIFKNNSTWLKLAWRRRGKKWPCTRGPLRVEPSSLIVQGWTAKAEGIWLQAGCEGARQLHMAYGALLRGKHNDIEKGLCTIDTWDVFKKEIKSQFYPENVTYEARKKLRELKHKNNINASNFAIGGVLIQEGHPIAFESRKLNDTEWRYTVQEKKMTVVHCLRTWRHYLLGSRFLIKTNNIATSYFQSQKNLSPKQARWQDFLAEFDYFSYNLMRSEATNQSPFEIAIGQQPLTPIAMVGDYKGRSPLAAQVARSWNEQADVACFYLDKAGCKMKKWADKKRRPKEYKLGDMVMLKLLP
ncbi:hypothetical protein RJ639_030172 [Escallonia herrerae]|uniref:Reverse transcriptase RNase H-like domain-containing protein n=1 Tax=Escallonia herrerae TaxID=1293975 RepID=A0AA89BD30_9ASTE|nr:hypothetical protein RJ639_030172 [Escallonia herrerae]